MRRAPIVLTGTAAGLAAVLSFKPHQPSLSAAASRTATPAPATSTPAPTSTAPATATSTRTATGDVEPTQYGNAQVRVTVSGGKITKIEALQLQGNDPKSVAISSYAEPLLRASALSRQSADIDMVSGATYTSESYKASLQSALDKLGFGG
jgi:uncharacterized protein with FMN-binding domain